MPFFFTLLSLRSPYEEELRVEFMYNGFPLSNEHTIPTCRSVVLNMEYRSVV